MSQQGVLQCQWQHSKHESPLMVAMPSKIDVNMIIWTKKTPCELIVLAFA